MCYSCLSFVTFDIIPPPPQTTQNFLNMSRSVRAYQRSAMPKQPIHKCFLSLPPKEQINPHLLYGKRSYKRTRTANRDMKGLKMFLRSLSLRKYPVTWVAMEKFDKYKIKLTINVDTAVATSCYSFSHQQTAFGESSQLFLRVIRRKKGI